MQELCLIKDHHHHFNHGAVTNSIPSADKKQLPLVGSILCGNMYLLFIVCVCSTKPVGASFFTDFVPLISMAKSVTVHSIFVGVNPLTSTINWKLQTLVLNHKQWKMHASNLSSKKKMLSFSVIKFISFESTFVVSIAKFCQSFTENIRY